MASLIAAAFWLVIAAGLLGWQALHPDNPFLVIRGTGISFGWLAVVFAVYNLVRWWSNRSAGIQRQALDEQAHPPRGAPKAPRASPANPDFDFSDRPPGSS